MENQQKLKGNEKICEFIHKLVDIMENFPEYFYWNSEGDEIIIDRLKEVEGRVLAKYFRHTKLSSFIRQLNIYGFCKMEHTENSMKFSHKIFKRGNLSQFASIKRKSKLNSKQKQKISSSQNSEIKLEHFLNILNFSQSTTQILTKSLASASKLHQTLTSLTEDIYKLSSLSSLLPQESSLVNQINLQFQETVYKILPQSKIVSDLVNNIIDNSNAVYQNVQESNINDEDCSFDHSLKQKVEQQSQITQQKKFDIIGQGLERAIQQQHEIYRFVVAMEQEQLYSLEN